MLLYLQHLRVMWEKSYIVHSSLFVDLITLLSRKFSWHDCNYISLNVSLLSRTLLRPKFLYYILRSWSMNRILYNRFLIGLQQIEVIVTIINEHFLLLRKTTEQHCPFCQNQFGPSNPLLFPVFGHNCVLWTGRVDTIGWESCQAGFQLLYLMEHGEKSYTNIFMKKR